MVTIKKGGEKYAKMFTPRIPKKHNFWKRKRKLQERESGKESWETPQKVK